MFTVSTKLSTDASNIFNDQFAVNKKYDEKTQAEIDRLKERDKEVRQHEEAHKRAAGGLLTVGPKYDYEIGPDGKKYAVSGEIQIDIAEIPGNPEATLKKAKQVQRAALAPREPSPQDNAIAANAANMELKAKQELTKQQKTDSISSYEETSGTKLQKVRTYDSRGKLKSDEIMASTVDIIV
ncbi:MAG: putative metalloprotease CJM1_0395 family protein [bacterium]